ncbi:MAG: radical SAM family heme chaperone HemW [Deltaproteobacteria bacterium]|nr:radical SAM family heme chaperone HemW [Deltaproteobacteria bacterium]
MAPPARSPVVRPAGVYIHVPWCKHRCAYCDFYFVVGRPDPRFAQAVVDEWRERRGQLGEAPALVGLYFGGGTPGLLLPEQVHAIISAVGREAALTPGAEVTLEVNPRDVSPASVAAWRAAGVTRVSLGVQSFHDATLKRLGRGHTGADARTAVERLAGAGFRELSIDLIFGADTQGADELDRDLALASSMADHVSVYCLTYEEGTHLTRLRSRGRLAALDSDGEADRYERVQARLTASGFRQYEPSNYARPGHEAVHNRLYWQGRAYLGLGPGAASYLRYPDGTAWRGRNAPDLEGYLAGRAHIVDEEHLDGAHALADRMFAGLRDMERGIALDALEAEHQVRVPGDVEGALEQYAREGLLERAAPRCFRVTARGALLADRIASSVLRD